jgi:hypothetical protein
LVRPDAKPTLVPGVVQNVFTDFHGPAWYYREFDVPVHPHENGRYFLRFGAEAVTEALAVISRNEGLPYK